MVPTANRSDGRKRPLAAGYMPGMLRPDVGRLTVELSAASAAV
jgi:hypothetical protein